MYLTDYYHFFAVGCAPHYYPFAKDYQRTIMASQAQSFHYAI